MGDRAWRDDGPKGERPKIGIQELFADWQSKIARNFMATSCPPLSNGIPMLIPALELVKRDRWTLLGVSVSSAVL